MANLWVTIWLYLAQRELHRVLVIRPYSRFGANYAPGILLKQSSYNRKRLLPTGAGNYLESADLKRLYYTDGNAAKFWLTWHGSIINSVLGFRAGAKIRYRFTRGWDL